MKLLYGLLLVSPILFAVGCGDSTSTTGVIVTGTLVDGGKAVGSTKTTDFTNPNKFIVQIKLVNAQGMAVGNSTVDADGKFQMDGVLPGTYKVAVSKTSTTMGQGSANSTGNTSPTATDEFKDKYSAANSKISVTIPSGSTHNLGEIDLAKN